MSIAATGAQASAAAASAGRPHGITLAAGPLSRSATGPGIDYAQAAPPGLLLRGERATLTAVADSIEGGNVDYTAYVRASPKAGFTRLAMHISGGGSTQWRVPARFLTGSVLEDYVVVRDPRGGDPVTVPPAGARAPFRSWIVSRPVPVALGTHGFGRFRKPQAVVARAPVGTGPGQVGFSTPKGEVGSGPSSFDVAPDGTVWVADRVNSRLLAYAPGTPRRPERTITTPQSPLEVAIAPRGTIYVLAGAPISLDHPRQVYAFAPDGTWLWAAPVAGGIYNDLMRVDRDGIPWIEDFGDAWLPVTGRSGHPLTVAQQIRGMAPYDYQPIGRGLRLVDLAIYPTEDRIGLATSDGTLLRSWRVTSRTAFQPVWPQARAGRDIVEMGTVGKPASGGYELEFLVVRFSPAGQIIDRFALDARQSYGWNEFTRIRVGPDGHLYYLQTSPKWGMRVARYQLRSAPRPPGLAPPASAAPSRTSASPGSQGTLPPAGTSHEGTGAADAAGHAALLSVPATRPRPAAAGVPASFEPASASFRSPASGVVVGAVGCGVGRACKARLVATTDSGAHWHFLKAPDVRLPNPGRGAVPANVTGVVFASSQNGWLYGPALWSTHDGGAHWSKISLGGAISRMAASAGTVYAVVTPPGKPSELFASPAGRSAWNRVGQVTGSTLAVYGHAAWVGTSTHLWATADGAHWHQYPFSCPAGYTEPFTGLGSITAASRSDVSFLCLGESGAGSELKAVLTSVNGGRTVRLAGPAPSGGSGGVIAVPPHRPKVITLGTEFFLDRTANGGRTWTGTFENNGGSPWNFLFYASRTAGWAEFGQPPYGGLLRTTDAGRSWHKIRF